MQKPVFVIDGDKFSTLEGFFDEIERVLIPGAAWGRNLDAFNDILRGGFGTPEGGFVLRWQKCDRSQNGLGYPETVHQLQNRLTSCHPTNRAAVMEQLEQAKKGIGSTVFDWLVEIIRRHGPEGQEAEDGVELVLE